MTTRALVVEGWREVVGKFSEWISELPPTWKALSTIAAAIVVTWTASITYMSRQYASRDEVIRLGNEMAVMDLSLRDLNANVSENTRATDSLRSTVMSLDLTACLILMEIRTIVDEMEGTRPMGAPAHLTWEECRGN